MHASTTRRADIVVRTSLSCEYAWHARGGRINESDRLAREVEAANEPIERVLQSAGDAVDVFR